MHTNTMRASRGYEVGKRATIGIQRHRVSRQA